METESNQLETNQVTRRSKQSELFWSLLSLEMITQIKY